MKIKAIVIDLDGTITTEDISGILTDLVGKKEESLKLAQMFQEGKLKGLEGLIERINFLKGLSVDKLQAVVLRKDYIRDGAKELFSFLKENNIISIIASGNIMPVLEVYKEKLGVDYLVGSKPIIENNRIVSISENEYSGIDFKVRDLKEILSKLNISLDSLVAIGDSIADKGMFEISAKSIVINPKGNIEQYADYVIEDDLSKVIPILKDLMK